MESIFQNVGLQLLNKKTVACPFIYRNVEEGIKSFISTGTAASATKHNQKNVVEPTIAKVLDAFRIIDDLHFLQNHFLVFTATK